LVNIRNFSLLLILFNLYIAYFLLFPSFTCSGFFVVDFKDDFPTLFCPFFFPSWGQCHQHFTHGFFIQKSRYLYLHFKLVLFWNKNIGAKAALQMLVKLTPRVNFISKFTHSICLCNIFAAQLLFHQQFLDIDFTSCYAIFVIFYTFCNILFSSGVNFTNILRPAFSYESFARSFFCTKI
jgi:hypothetical protein